MKIHFKIIFIFNYVSYRDINNEHLLRGINIKENDMNDVPVVTVLQIVVISLRLKSSSQLFAISISMFDVKLYHYCVFFNLYDIKIIQLNIQIVGFQSFHFSKELNLDI